MPNRAESLTAPFFGHDPRAFVLPPSEVADELERLENSYVEWLRPAPHWPTKFTLWLAAKPIEIFRLQVHALCLACAKLLNERHAQVLQEAERTNMTGVIMQRMKLRNFLLTHFPGDVERADVRGTDLVDACMARLLEQKLELENRLK